MLTREEKREGIKYQIELIKQEKAKEKKGHLTLKERDKITIFMQKEIRQSIKKY